MMDDLQYYRSFRFKLEFDTAEKYLIDRKIKYPDKDLHHILGSYSGHKTTGYLIVPIEHKFHLRTVHSNLPKYFKLFIAPAILQLLDYGTKTLMMDQASITFITKVTKLKVIMPEETITVIQIIKKREIQMKKLEKFTSLNGQCNVL